MTAAIISAAASRLTTAFPSWHDATGQVHPTPQAQLPAFALRVTYSDSARYAMGDPRTMHEGQLEIELEVATPADNEAGMQTLGRQVSQAVLTPDDDLGGAAWDLLEGSFEADHEKAETNISRGTLAMPIQVLE